MQVSIKSIQKYTMMVVLGTSPENGLVQIGSNDSMSIIEMEFLSEEIAERVANLWSKNENIVVKQRKLEHGNYAVQIFFG